MSDYENRPVPEGINYSQENPLKEFFLLVLAAAGALLVVFFSLSLAAQKLAPLVPFSMEERLVARFADQFPAAPDTEKAQRIEQYLQSLAISLLQSQPLPEGLHLTIHYLPSETLNAFATLGGNVYVLDGLIDAMDSENALAMVLAHEIAHILHRDPIVAMGRGLTVSLALASVTGFSNSGAADWLIQQLGLATVMSFTRDQERAADAVALEMLQAHYGNVHGAETLFQLMSERSMEPPELLNTHPLSSRRLAAIEAFARRHPQQGQLKPLPEFLQQ